MNRRNKKNNKILKRIGNKKGPAFTLVEIIVIIFIISVGLIGVLSLVIQNIQSQVINKNSIVAYQLAQEGIELVRKTRDTNWTTVNFWNQGLEDGTYFMDYLNETPQILGDPGSANWYKNVNGYYVHDAGGELTNFSRTIEIININTYSMSVKAHISWSNKKQTFDYYLETRLYDWY